MKRILLFVISIITLSCSNSGQDYFKKYDESKEVAEQQKNKNFRMRFKHIQSQFLDKNEIFRPLNKYLKNFLEKDYLSLKELIIEKDIPTIQKYVQEGKLTYEKIVLFYLYRIRKYESNNKLYLNSIISLNPYVIEQAREKDKNKPENTKYTLYGLPVLLKDNINTKDMPTTAGALALKNNKNTDDAFIVKKLKENGALILGKSNLSEWAYYFSTNSPMGYSSNGRTNIKSLWEESIRIW